MADFSDTLRDDLGDRYAIERELGHGATATVYLARDTKFDRLVALKILSPDLALAVPTERFLREIRTTAQLSNPHIVPLFDSGSVDGRPYYVMRYVRGESLKDRLAREGPLPVAEGLRIARQVAAALDHAHRHGVIHRDIKPGNILLEDGHVWIADFGIARAIALTESQTVTNTGVTIGTPAYMSPEQAMGESKLDAGTDIYSLGCVLYEMLTGKLPFTGPDVQSVLNKHLIEPHPSVRLDRPDVPEQVERLLEVALAKKRRQRFATAAEFAEALSLEGAGPLTPTWTQPVRVWRRVRVPRWAVSGVGGAFMVVAAFLAWKFAFGAVPALDPTVYFVTPFVRAEGVPASLDAGRLLQDALNAYTGIKVLGRFEARGDGAFDAGAARRRAREQRAGHYVRGEVSSFGDSIRVRAALYSTPDGSLVRERAITLGARLAGADSLFSILADRMLFEDTVVTANGGRAATRSFEARQAFARGLSAVQEWDLAMADSAFRQAAEHDLSYAQAHLWVAQVRFWNEEQTAVWRSWATQADAGRARLSDRDRQLSDALVARSRDDFVGACETWKRLAVQMPHDFAGWYGLATCLRQDQVVLPDSRSPSGWRFRSSYYRATRAYQRAFELLPAMHKSMSGASYSAVRRLLMTRGDQVRGGHSLPPDSGIFAAHPVWQGDSLAFVPYPRSRFEKSQVVAEGLRVAVRRERDLFHDIATAWASAFPESPDALEALAVSLELLGDSRALDKIARARLLSATREQRVRLAGTEAWMRVKFSAPRDTAGLRAARLLADSVLGWDSSGTQSNPMLLASLAALTGRAGLAAARAQAAAAAGEWDVPPRLLSSALPLLVFAALGGPGDSLRELESQIDAAIDGTLLSSEQADARIAWLVRPARLAFPEFQFVSLPKLRGKDFLLEAQVALERGDTSFVRATMRRVSSDRRWISPADIALEGVFAEARLIAASGDLKGAATWLDRTLSMLAASDPQAFGNPVNAGTLVRAMALRADLASRVGDGAGAAQWGRAVEILWSDCDAFLRPTVDRMHVLAERL